MWIFFRESDEYFYFQVIWQTAVVPEPQDCSLKVHNKKFAKKKKVQLDLFLRETDFCLCILYLFYFYFLKVTKNLL